MTEAPVYTPVPMTTMTTGEPAAYTHKDFRRSQPRVIVSSSSSSPRSSRSGWRTCADVAIRAGSWVSRRRFELIPASATSTLTILGMQQGSIIATGLFSLLGAGSAAAAFLGLKYKSEPITKVGAGAVMAFGDMATASAAGFAWPTATAFVLSTGAAYAVYGPWLAAQRNTRMKLHVDTVKAKGAVPAAMGLEAADSGLIGASIQETALRRAIHALTGVTPLDIPSFTLTEGGGFNALVVMPAGKNTSPDSIIRRRVQLAANLGLDGTLHLKQGTADNQLDVRLVAADILAGTLPYSDDGCTSIADPLRLGLDEHGLEVLLQILYRHTLIAGASDWGKSGLLNLIIKRLVRRPDVDLYGIDMKPGSVELGPWRPLMKKVATGIEEAHDLLDFLKAENERRGQHLGRLQQEALARGEEPPRKWIPGVHGNAIVVITDELAELIRQDEEFRKREAEYLKSLTKEAREYADPPTTPAPDKYQSLLALSRSNAIQFVSATQQPSRKVFGDNTDTRGNYGNRISTRVGEAGHGPLIFGQGSQKRGWRPEILDLPGKFLISAADPANEEPRICRAEYVSDADIAADVSGLYARDLHQQSSAFTKPAAPRPAPLLYPNGQQVTDWPDLYRVFVQLGSATKDELRKHGPYDSRDTVRRALDTWTSNGVQSRQEGRSTIYYLPEEAA